jgi:hypothetical protein
LFLDYTRDAGGNNTGLRIIDQFGESDVPAAGAAGARHLRWQGSDQAIWIAANWTE